MTTTAENAILWFKTQFSASVAKVFQGTPFSVDMAAAIAMQETFADCWGRLYQTQPVATVLKLCVGDTLDYPRRSASAFPRDKADLCQTAAGQQMFDIARQALLDIAKVNKDYAGAAKNPNKFCHGYGIFQYDIQHFKEASGRDFFLQHGWCDFEQCAAKLLEELQEALARAYGSHKTTLNDEEMMYVAVAYNAGHVRIGGGPKQGFQDGDGKYYGENFQTYLAIAHTTKADAPEIAVASESVTPPVTPLSALARQVLAVIAVKQAQNAAASINRTQPAALSNQVDQFIKLLAALNSTTGPAQLGPVNGALGQTIGNALDGRKSAIGIIGAMVTSVLQAVGPDMTTPLPVIGSFNGIGQAALPLFLAMAAWGVLGKLEKWST
jgi:hypothetical protein